MVADENVPTLSDPVAISILGLEIRWYAIFVLTGIVCSLVNIRWLARDRGLDPEFPLDAAPWVVIPALFGARLYYIVLKWGHFLDNPDEAINVRLGGLTVHGAIAGGVIGLYVYCHRRGQRFLTWGDLVAASLPIGQALGRWGNWANQEAFGTPTEVPWAVTIAPAQRPAEYADSATFHPTFLYESVLDICLAIGLIAVIRAMPTNRFWREGDVIWLYLAGYGAIRFMIEPVRTDSLYIGPFPAAMWISAGMIVAGVLMLAVRHTIWPGMIVADFNEQVPDETSPEQATPV